MIGTAQAGAYRLFLVLKAMDRQKITEDLPVGGQAVIEGVMMRVPGKIVTAVRKADKQIVVRQEEHVALTQRYRWLNIPVLRGCISFFEMMIIGLRALNFSADMAMQEAASNDPNKESESQPADTQRSEWRDKAALGLTMVFSMSVGIAVFFFLPLFIAQFTGAQRDALQFNLAAGLVRMTLFLLYLWGISHWEEIRRVFQYHGAEHKSIFTLEANAPLSVDSARTFPRLHPRCGTSFLLIVVLLAIVVFALADTAFVQVFGHEQSLLERFATHLSFLPLISGISFELLKLSGKKRNHPLTKILITPGLWLQRITTREPSDDQLEVALVALHCALDEPTQVEYTLVP